MNLRPALFLDRDGVINEEVNYLWRIEDCRLIPGIATLIRTANQLGIATIVVTNQAGIGRGMYTEDDFHRLMNHMQAELKAEGATLDAIYFSPFHPEHGLGDYKRVSDCRKPAPGMILRAAQEHGLDLARSAMIGDRCTDMDAGAAAGIPFLFLYGSTEEKNCTKESLYRQIDTLEQVTPFLQQLTKTDQVAAITTDQ